VVILLYVSCANQVALTGGEKDIVPPKLDTSISSTNNQLRFETQEIYLEFDEFINFRNPSQQIVISPPLEYGLEIDQRGKKVKINFDQREVLKKDATYILNFGEAISDYTENNVLKNFSFVFSTGDYIDSLSMKGRVQDAETHEPLENMTVMLYDEIRDSVVFKERPFYFAKTDQDGSFELNNLRSDTFKIVVLEDLNLNYLYEENAERFGFLKEVVFLRDTSQIDVTIDVFKSESSPKYQEGKVIHDGLISLSFDQKIWTNPVIVADKNVKNYSEIEGATVKFYIEEIDKYPLNFAVFQDSLFDTISIRRPPIKDQKNLPELKIIGSNVDSKSGLHPLDTLKVLFNIPLLSLDHDLIDLGNSNISIDSGNIRQVNITSVWQEGKDYTLSLDSGSIVDFFNRAIDSTAFEFEIGRRNSFGSLSLGLNNAEDSLHYIISLIQGDKMIKTWQQISTADSVLTVERLPPGDYSLRIIEDRNNNGKWDPGNYLEKKYSEIIHEKSLEPLKENWTLEVSIDFAMLSKKENETSF